jgi:hypothetical protein
MNKFWFNNYIWLLAYYLLFYLKYLIKPLGLGPWNLTIVMILFVITHILIPLAILLRIASFYKDYSFKSLVNVFLISFLVFLPLIQLIILGFGAIGHQKETVDVFFSIIPISALLSIFGGLFGLLLNSTYIFVSRLTAKK